MIVEPTQDTNSEGIFNVTTEGIFYVTTLKTSLPYLTWLGEGGVVMEAFCSLNTQLGNTKVAIY